MCFVTSFSLVEFPGLAHKRYEVRVVVDVSRHGRVVVVPLLASDDAVAVPVAEAGQELHKHLLVCHLAADHLRVVACVVHHAQVGRGDRAVAVLVELGEALANDLHAGRVRHAADAVQEFVVAHHAILIRVQVLKQKLGLAFGDICAQVLQAPVELLLVDLAVAIVVHDAEGATHTADGSHATTVQAGFNLLENWAREEEAGLEARQIDFVTYFRRGQTTRPLDWKT